MNICSMPISTHLQTCACTASHIFPHPSAVLARKAPIVANAMLNKGHLPLHKQVSKSKFGITNRISIHKST